MSLMHLYVAQPLVIGCKPQRAGILEVTFPSNYIKHSTARRAWKRLTAASPGQSTRSIAETRHCNTAEPSPATSSMILCRRLQITQELQSRHETNLVKYNLPHYSVNDQASLHTSNHPSRHYNTVHLPTQHLAV